MQKMRAALEAKDKSLQDSVVDSPGANDALMQQLQSRLLEKERFLQGVLADRDSIAASHEKHIANLMDRLRSRDEQIKVRGGWSLVFISSVLCFCFMREDPLLYFHYLCFALCTYETYKVKLN